MTFSRGSVKWGIGSDKALRLISSGTPAMVWDALSGAARGILIEEAVDNIYFPSDDLTALFTSSPDVSWGSTIPAPHPTALMYKLTADATTGAKFYSKTTTFNGRQNFSLEYLIKAAEFGRGRINISDSQVSGNSISATFDLGAGTIVGTQAGTGTLIGATLVPRDNGVFKMTLSGQPTTNVSQTGLGHRFELFNTTGLSSYTGDGTSGLYLGLCNMKVSSAPSSYIQATSGTVTRVADLLQVTSVTPWFLNSAGTLYTQVCIPYRAPTDKSQTIIRFDDVVGDNVVMLENPANSLNIRGLVMSSGASVFDQIGGTFTPGVPFKVAISWTGNRFAISVNGAAALTDTSGGAPVGITRCLLGASNTSGANCLNGMLMRVKQSPVAQEATDLPLLTM